MDWSGATLTTAGLGALVYGLIRLQTERSDTLGWAAVIGGLIILAFFIYEQMRARHPMMPLALFRSRSFSIANLYTLLMYTALGGSLYFFPFVLIDVQKYTPTAAGAAGLPFVFLVFPGGKRVRPPSLRRDRASDRTLPIAASPTQEPTAGSARNNGMGGAVPLRSV